MGSNLGDRLGNLCRALSLLKGGDLSVEAVSPVYESPAMTKPPHAPQPAYLNAVVRVRSALLPDDLLRFLLAIERQLGRVRTAEQWTPRMVDLDLLVYGNHVVEKQRLALPHPGILARRFVLQPLLDLDPFVPFPPFQELAVTEALDQCPDLQPVQRTSYALESCLS